MSDSSQFLLYTAPDGAVKVDVFFKDETAWLTQKALAELFGVKVPAVNKHLKNIFESGELAEDSVVSILETTATDGKNYLTRFYQPRCHHRRRLPRQQLSSHAIPDLGDHHPAGIRHQRFRVGRRAAETGQAGLRV